MSILLTTSATSVSEERANSAFRFIKTDYRSTISEDRKNFMIRLFSIKKFVSFTFLRYFPNVKVEYKGVLSMIMEI